MDSYLKDFSGSQCGEVVLGTTQEPRDVVVRFGPQGVHLGSDTPMPAKAEVGASWAPWRNSTGLCGQSPATKAEWGS